MKGKNEKKNTFVAEIACSSRFSLDCAPDFKIDSFVSPEKERCSSG